MTKAKSRFFAYLERLRWIKRWGLMRNVVEENVMEHSWQVSTIAHMLAVIDKEMFNGTTNPADVATTALYHDTSEIITGDLPTPIKYHSKKITDAYKEIEKEAEHELLGLLPPALQSSLRPYLLHDHIDPKVNQLIKAADLISAYLKCQVECNAGNKEFDDAKTSIEQSIRALDMPAVGYYMQTFTDSYLLTLDELLREHDKQTDK